jgi:hypothetical protein
VKIEVAVAGLAGVVCTTWGVVLLWGWGWALLVLGTLLLWDFYWGQARGMTRRSVRERTGQ